MNRKQKFRIIGINLFLFALLFLFITLNKKVLRPLVNSTSFVSVITGSFPNFIAAYMISLAFVNAILIRKPQRDRLIVYLSSALVFIILTVEELFPIWGASTQYDPYDILASGLGSLLSILTFEIIVRNTKAKSVELQSE